MSHPPSDGEMIGAMLITSMSIEYTRAESPSSNESRTTARAITMPVAPASPITKRATIRASIERVKAHASEARANAADP